MPVTGPDLFGREEDIAFLDDAWANPDVNVVSIVAWASHGMIGSGSGPFRATVASFITPFVKTM